MVQKLYASHVISRVSLIALFLLSGYPVQSVNLLGAEQAASSTQTYIVIAASAPVMAGDRQIGAALTGTVLLTSRTQGNWKYAAEKKGWIHVRDLILLQDAEAKFTRDLEAKPAAQTYQLRGIARMANSNWAQAAQDFEKAYDLGDASVSVHMNLGECYQRMGEPGAAIKEYDDILKAYPDDAPAMLARGNLLLQLGQYSASLRDFDQVITLNPKSSDSYNSRGVALRMLGRFEDASEAYSKALELDPKRADSLSNRGYAQKNLGDLQGALKDYEAAVVLAPDSNAIRNDLAWLLATAADESIRNGDRAVEISEDICKQTNNQNGEFLDTLAAAYACKGRFPAAIEAAKLALTVLGENPGAAKVQERLELFSKDQAYIEPVAAKPDAVAAPEATPVDSEKKTDEKKSEEKPAETTGTETPAVEPKQGDAEAAAESK